VRLLVESPPFGNRIGEGGEWRIGRFLCLKFEKCCVCGWEVTGSGR
jgi:hypothetical protein